MRRDLSSTLLELIRGVTPNEGSGLVVTEATLDVPLEISLEEDKGTLRLLGSVPYSRWKSGFLPATHLTHLEVVLVEENGHAR
jgi:hypothetical protein